MSTSPNGAGLADDQAAKRQRYEDALDRWAGFEPGESQLPDEEIMARRAARRNAAVRQHQAAAPPEAVQVPFEAIVAQLMMNPGMAEHLDGIDLDGDGVPDFPMGPPPVDSMGRMQWQSLMENRHRMAQASRRIKDQRKDANNQVILAHLQRLDPLFPQVFEKVRAYVHSLPRRLQRPFLMAVDETPGAYLDLYKEMRDLITVTMRIGGRSAAVSGSARLENPREAIRKAVAGRMSAPVLESAGMQDDRLPGASRDAEKRALVKRVKAGGAKEGDLLRYLELCGV